MGGIFLAQFVSGRRRIDEAVWHNYSVMRKAVKYCLLILTQGASFSLILLLVQMPVRVCLLPEGPLLDVFGVPVRTFHTLARVSPVFIAALCAILLRKAIILMFGK